MAILNDLMVKSAARIIGDTYASRFIKDGGTSTLVLMADGSVKVLNLDNNETDIDLSKYLPLTAGLTKPLTGDLYLSAASDCPSIIFQRTGSGNYDWKLNNSGTFYLQNSTSSSSWTNRLYIDTSGNITVSGTSTSTGFKKTSSSNDYVLLGGGGHKLIFGQNDVADNCIIKQGLIKLADHRNLSSWTEPWYRVATIKASTGIRTSSLIYISSASVSDIVNVLLSVRAFWYTSSSNLLIVEKIWGSWPIGRIRIYYDYTSELIVDDNRIEIWVLRSSKHDGRIITRVIENSRQQTSINCTDTIILDQRLTAPSSGETNANNTLINSIGNPSTLYTNGEYVHPTYPDIYGNSFIKTLAQGESGDDVLLANGSTISQSDLVGTWGTVSGANKTIWGATYVNSSGALQSVTGNLTMPSGKYIKTSISDTSGTAILYYENGNIFGAFGNGTTNNIPTYIRSTDDNLYHRKGNSSASLDYKILDANNYTDYAVSLTTDQSISGIKTFTSNVKLTTLDFIGTATNYINLASDSNLYVTVNGATSSNSIFMIEKPTGPGSYYIFRPYANGEGYLGRNDYKWGGVYATSFYGNATSATTATNLKNNPSIQAGTTDTSAITITAGEKTSNEFTVPFATTATSATNATKVKWSSSSSNYNYPLAFCTTASPTSGNYYQNYYNIDLKFNPSTKTLTTGHISPLANNTYNLGSDSYRWTNIYTNNISVNNNITSGGIIATNLTKILAVNLLDDSEKKLLKFTENATNTFNGVSNSHATVTLPNQLTIATYQNLSNYYLYKYGHIKLKSNFDYLIIKLYYSALNATINCQKIGFLVYVDLYNYEIYELELASNAIVDGYYVYYIFDISLFNYNFHIATGTSITFKLLLKDGNEYMTTTSAWYLEGIYGNNTGTTSSLSTSGIFSYYDADRVSILCRDGLLVGTPGGYYSFYTTNDLGRPYVKWRESRYASEVNYTLYS